VTWWWKWHDFILLYGWIKLHFVCIPCFLIHLSVMDTKPDPIPG
jgi:hypothetical protein